MAIEIIVAGSSFVVAVVACGGVVASYRRNGKSAAARDERLAINQENIIKTLDDENDGLAALGRKVNDMVNHCGVVSTGLTERMNAAERDIKDGKQRRTTAP